MANLLATLLHSASSLEAYSRVLEVTQTNVANASTPGYARQSQQLEALPFDPTTGLAGGVKAGEMQSARDEYGEQAVRRQNTALGKEQQAAASLSSLQSIFDISGKIGIPNALNRFFQSVSGWGQNPSSTAARQTVIDRATEVAQNFQSSASQLMTLAQDTETQLHSTVDRVNQLVGQIRGYNEFIQQTATGSRDMGLDAQVHAALENLSQLVSVSAARQEDGTTTILLNGSTPLLIGAHQYEVRIKMDVPADPPPVIADAPPTAQLVAADGTVITSRTTAGQLGALLEMRNHTLPYYMGDSYQAGALNRMAQQFADRVNQILTDGNISDGPPPVPGVPLLAYNTGNLTMAAGTMTIDPAITTDQLAAISPGPPYISNGIPLALSQMATPTSADDQIDGFSFTEFYGGMAALAGSKLEAAQKGEQVQQSLVAQARNQRDQVSGVSLDEEAMVLVEFQRAYQANSRFITILDQLTQEIINLLR